MRVGLEVAYNGTYLVLLVLINTYGLIIDGKYARTVKSPNMNHKNFIAAIGNYQVGYIDPLRKHLDKLQ